MVGDRHRDRDLNALLDNVDTWLTLCFVIVNGSGSPPLPKCVILGIEFYSYVFGDVLCMEYSPINYDFGY